MSVGFGMLFGGKDTGLLKKLKAIGQSLVGIDESADKAGKGLSGIDRAISGLSLGQLSGIGGQLDQIQSSASGLTSGGIDTQMEQMFTTFDQSFAKGAANAGIFGSELRSLESDVFSTAFAMNRDADSIGMDSGIRTTWDCKTTTFSANAPLAIAWCSLVPSGIDSGPWSPS